LRSRTLAALLVLAIILGAGAGYLIGTTNQRTTTSVSVKTTRVSSAVGQSYLNVPAIYSDLGYPKITYSSYSPYLPSEPNFTMQYQTKNTSFQVGSVGGDVISLQQAVGMAAEESGLGSSDYNLAEADFEPGVVVNSTLSLRPEWLLFFARVYEGYWLWGDVGNTAVSVEVNLDALNGTVYPSRTPPISGVTSSSNLASLPSMTNLELRVNLSVALDAVRNSGLSGIPKALSSDGSITFVYPRIVLFGPSSNNAAFMDPINASLSGHYDLCWVIGLFSPTSEYGYQGTFAVDARTGELVSGWAQALFPSMQIEGITGSLDYSSASNLAVSQEVFQIDGSVIGRSGSLTVTVPNVLVAKPGSIASIELNFTSTMTKSVNATLHSLNPLPGFEPLSSSGTPRGVSLQLEPQALVVPGNGSADARLLISIDKDAPSGTYLIEVNGILYYSGWAQPGTSSVLFLLSVWSGAGQWPPPPTVE
jgi:hypothetical protein